MRLSLWVTCLAVALAGGTAAQPLSKLKIDSASEAGKSLQAISQQNDEPRKQVLMEEFLAAHPKHPSVPWVSGQLQAIYNKQRQFDKALAVGEASAASEPNDLEVSYRNLKAAEGKQDPDLIGKWAVRTSELSRKVVAEAKLSAEEIDYARQLDIYAEYSLYATALQQPDPAKIIALVETLERQNPKSQYLSKVYGKYFAALRQLGQGDKAGARAEKIAADDPGSEDALLIAADYNLQKKNQPDKVIDYSAKLLNLLKSKPRPEGISDADWVKKKDPLLGLAYWMLGITYSEKGNYVEADAALRAALPLLKDDQVSAVGLFHLGFANYQLAQASKDKTRLQDALRFSELSASTKGPYQIQAQKNVRQIRSELRGK